MSLRHRLVGRTPVVVIAIALSTCPAAQAGCGDGVIDAEEQCDDGTENGGSRSCCTQTCALSAEAPDLIVAEIYPPRRWGNLDGITAYSFGSAVCNVGDCWANAFGNTAEHPVVAQNLFRLKDGRFEQLGQSWLKHMVAAYSGVGCSGTCAPPADYTHLGVNCMDGYSESQNGAQASLGPKSVVNPSTGAFPGSPPFSTGPYDVILRRLQAHDADLDPDLNVGALYFAEVQYLSRDDAAGSNHANNASYQRVTVGPAPSYDLTLRDTIRRQRAAIQAWKVNDPSVTETILDGGGRLILSATATALGDGVYHYEYALQNLASDRAGGSFSVPIPAGTVVTNVGFHDVGYHSGEPYSGADWVQDVSEQAVTWTTETYASNANGNALRWGTLYNFRFDAHAAPGGATAVLGFFKPGSPASIPVSTIVPTVCASCAPDCDPASPDMWATPGEVRDLRLARSGGETTLTWNPPVDPGATSPRYDTLRSQVVSDFVNGGACIEADGTDTASTGGEDPESGKVVFYLVRCENGCPIGEGALGFASGGTVRVAGLCP